MVLSYCSSKVAENLPRLSASTVVARFPDFKMLTVAPGYASPEKRTAVLGMLTPPPAPPLGGRRGRARYLRADRHRFCYLSKGNRRADTGKERKNCKNRYFF